MKPQAAADLAVRISRALISASNHTRPTRSWSPSLEHTLHKLGCRSLLSPSLVAAVIDPFLLNHHSLALGFFNWASQQPGFAHTPITYQSILKSLSLSRQFSAIDSLLKQIQDLKFSVDPSVYRSIIASQIVGKKIHNAFLLFGQVSYLVPEIGSETCNSLLAALASDGYLDSAEKVFGEMTRKSIPLSTLGFGVFIWRLCKVGELKKVLSILDEVQKCSSGINGSVVAVLIIHGLCHASMVSEAFWMLDELRNRGWKSDFMAYRIVAVAFQSMGNVADEEKVLKKKRKLGVAPRANDYKDTILALILERLISEAKELGEIIVGGNFPIEDDVLNILIGSVSTIDPDSAIMFFNFMVGKEKFPSLLTVSNLGRSLCKHGKFDELLEVFQVLNCHNCFKDLEGYNAVLSILCRAGRVKEGYGVLQDMKKKGIVPDVSSYNFLMEACCKQDLLRPAKKLWDEMFASQCCGNLKTYNILIRKFCEVGQIEEAQRLFYHMLGKELEPDAATFTSLLEGLCKEAKLEAAFELFNQSIKQDTTLARDILNTFMLSLCSKGHLMTASKFICSLSPEIQGAESHLTLIKYLADAREIPIALEHLKWVKERSPWTLNDIRAGLLASLSSVSCSQSIIQFLQMIPDA
ncbi:pentatricopeptide repeat-containing protein At5g14080-like [Neltuma alba]|uniref:pentatricopeptide repeat-containing protein At5g14080 n=1 Tax=Neltuma alba TaxID=207710 RepID=UPI0010A31805|nr:pentatricopeptide repeat-containing protein At5g14080 [Prosopis alba]XP_028786142.1 pentatricopeptide repeat-containing protein At5g14080-like [Prosopis alba]